MKSPRKERELGRLLVEGKKDVYAIAELMKRFGFDFDARPSGVPEIQPCDGCEGVLAALPVALKTYSRVGVVMDADQSQDGRWQQLANLLARHSISVPTHYAQDGIVCAGLKPEFILGIWIMPGNANTGYLEDFLGNLVATTDATWDYAKDSCLEAKRLGAPFNDIHFSKARLHTWLAWRENPGSTFGVAFQQGWLRADAVLAKLFASWFVKVFPEGIEPQPAESVTD